MLGVWVAACGLENFQSQSYGLFLLRQSYFILTADKQMSELKLKGRRRQAAVAASGKLVKNTPDSKK